MLRHITFCCAALLLAACSGGDDVQNGSVGVLREASQAIQTATRACSGLATGDPRPAGRPDHPLAGGCHRKRQQDGLHDPA